MFNSSTISFIIPPKTDAYVSGPVCVSVWYIACVHVCKMFVWGGSLPLFKYYSHLSRIFLLRPLPFMSYFREKL